MQCCHNFDDCIFSAIRLNHGVYDTWLHLPSRRYYMCPSLSGERFGMKLMCSSCDTSRAIAHALWRL